jgi:hypothetical protein
MAITKQTEASSIEVVGEFKEINYREKIKVLENGVLISESFTGTCYPPNTDVATLNSEVAAIANVVWTQSVKDAYAAAFPTEPMPEN